MIHYDVPDLEVEPLGGRSRWLVPAVAAAAAVSGGLLFLIFGQPLWAAAFLLLCVAAGWTAGRMDKTPVLPAEALATGPDYALIGSVLTLSRQAAALTDADGALLVANETYRHRFERTPPLRLGGDDESVKALEAARAMAWRDGAGCAGGIERDDGKLAVEVERVGARRDLLLWRFPEPSPASHRPFTRRLPNSGRPCSVPEPLEDGWGVKNDSCQLFDRDRPR